mmetsp:Transcript_21731/g.36567  ORF Transcript_21731/g.36567 Transcript_21731/m.36567 type:complete len:263 (-) Transcript_21731:473-1261(-)
MHVPRWNGSMCYGGWRVECLEGKFRGGGRGRWPAGAQRILPSLTGCEVRQELLVRVLAHLCRVQALLLKHYLVILECFLLLQCIELSQLVMQALVAAYVFLLRLPQVHLLTAQGLHAVIEQILQALEMPPRLLLDLLYALSGLQALIQLSFAQMLKNSLLHFAEHNLLAVLSAQQVGILIACIVFYPLLLENLKGLLRGAGVADAGLTDFVLQMTFSSLPRGLHLFVLLELAKRALEVLHVQLVLHAHIPTGAPPRLSAKIR